MKLTSAPNPSAYSQSWQWRNSFESLGSTFFTRVTAKGLPSPHGVAFSGDLAQALGLADEWLQSQSAIEALSGNTALPFLQPDQGLASVYSGHQFGVWAGQLGDGRALLLGGLHHAMDWQGVGPIDELELQLKGAGQTPYSRMGDGRAVLRSSLREFLCSEAMHHLGIPTTRALAVTGSAQPVRREDLETAAVVTRVAPSFIRFGHFEHFAAAGDTTSLRKLADYVINRFYPACAEADNPYAALLEAVAQRTCDLIAAWQAVGFCHGVMNTDNMSILGLTIDYGPFGFLDGFNPDHICNHSDHQGRYAYNKQPNVAFWNLFCLGQALMPLIEVQDAALAALEPYRTRFPLQLQGRLWAKLGLDFELSPEWRTSESKNHLDVLLKMLAKEQVDWTIFFSRWTDAVAVPTKVQDLRDLWIDRSAFDTWLRDLTHLSHQRNFADSSQHKANLDKMHQQGAAEADLGVLWQILWADEAKREAAHQVAARANPRVVLRNHLAQNAIAAAQSGDFGPTRQLLAVLSSPFDPAAPDEFTAFPPDWARSLEVSCSS